MPISPISRVDGRDGPAMTERAPHRAIGQGKAGAGQGALTLDQAPEGQTELAGQGDRPPPCSMAKKRRPDRDTLSRGANWED